MTAALLAYSPLLAVGSFDLWFALPLIVVVSLVYAATRHEAMDQILIGALRMGGWITGFMLVVFAVLVALSAMA